jgi:flagellar hook-associated protein 3 FlgL
LIVRITESISSRNLLENVSNLNERLERASAQASSGKKYDQLHESPSANSEMVRLKAQLSELDQYQANADNGSFFLNVADSALSSLHNIVTAIYTRGSAAANGTSGADTLATLAAEIRSLRDQIFSLANTQVRGRYIFAGSKVTSQAFSIAGDTVTYQGDSEVNSIEITYGLEVKENIPGSDAFDSVFTTVGALLTAVDGGDQAAIKSVLGQFSGVLSGVSQVRAHLGVDLGKLEDASVMRSGLESTIKARQSQVGDADMAAAISEVTRIQTALEATFGVGAIVGQKGLMDYLI